MLHFKYSIWKVCVLLWSNQTVTCGLPVRSACGIIFACCGTEYTVAEINAQNLIQRLDNNHPSIQLRGCSLPSDKNCKTSLH